MKHRFTNCKVIIDDCIVPMTPMLLAQIWCNMHNDEQAVFFNTAAEIPEQDGWNMDEQLCWVTTPSGGLNAKGRELMSDIGKWADIRDRDENQ